MSPRTILPKTDGLSYAPIITGGIQKQLEKTGRLPPVTMQITPLDGKPFLLDRFLHYNFSSSILIPVEAFSFGFVAPDDSRPFNQIVKEGDLVTLYANGVILSRGVIDQTDVETDNQFGEKISITGRNLAGILEDQQAISADSKPILGGADDQGKGGFTISQVMDKLLANTRIQSPVISPYATKAPWIFMSEPGESKLAALQRYLEPLNLLFWVNENGSAVIGKPNMKQGSSGTLILSKSERRSNVISMKVVRSAAMLPTSVLPIWTGQELVQSQVSAEQSVNNAAAGPARLRRLKHLVPKTVVVSTPQGGASASDLSKSTALAAANGNLLRYYALRELARANQKEMIVQCVVPGHYNENGEKYHIDHVYQVIYDRGDVNESMYLFQVEYTLTEDRGQMSTLWFCRLGTIVADVPAP